MTAAPCSATSAANFAINSSPSLLRLPGFLPGPPLKPFTNWPVRWSRSATVAVSLMHRRIRQTLPIATLYCFLERSTARTAFPRHDPFKFKRLAGRSLTRRQFHHPSRGLGNIGSVFFPPSALQPVFHEHYFFAGL